MIKTLSILLFAAAALIAAAALVRPGTAAAGDSGELGGPKCSVAPQTMTPKAKDNLLKIREEVWRAWFAGDVKRLRELLPEEFVAITTGEAQFENLDSVLKGSKEFADSGGKLTRIEFTDDRIQYYGGSAIIYSNYLYELESGGARKTYKGRVTEIFVMDKSGALKHTGWHLDRGA